MKQNYIVNQYLPEDKVRGCLGINVNVLISFCRQFFTFDNREFDRSLKSYNSSVITGKELLVVTVVH